MIFTISRVSDNFRVAEMPNPMYSPHPKAEWDSEYEDWLINLETSEDIVQFCDKDVRVIIRSIGGMPHLEIDDLVK
jgi:hypothetical protein